MLLNVLLWATLAAAQVTAPLDATHPNLPRGHTMAAYRDCGAATDTDIAIARTKGESWAFPDHKGPLGTVDFDAERVEFEITGLQAGRDYVLGFTWWDADAQGRIQSVRVAPGKDGAWTTALPATQPLAFNAGEGTWARVLLPLPAAMTAAECMRVAFVCEAGPNAVVSEVWLLERGEAPPRKRVLIVTGDDYPGHLWRDTGPELAAILRKDPRLEVSITECPGIYASPWLNHYDATVLHFKDYAERMPLSSPVWYGLGRFVTAGKGLVIAHFGCGAFQEWPGFVNIAGRVWNPAMRAHDPYGPFEVRPTDRVHPVTRGMEAFKTEDELYTCLDGETPIRVLCESTSKVDGKDYPMAFTVDGTEGSVLHCPLGHDVHAFEAPGTRGLYCRAAAWAAGLEPR